MNFDCGTAILSLMPKIRVVVAIDADLLNAVDALVRQNQTSDRSAAIEAAVAGYVRRLRQDRLASACALLDPAEERGFAEEGMGYEGIGYG